MPLFTRKRQGVERFDPYDYDQCVRDATRLGNARMQRHSHLTGQTVHHDEFEKDAIGIIGECEFARFAGVSVASIYSTQSGDADFLYQSYRVEVKTFAFDPQRPTRTCSLLVRVEDLIEIPSDFYVLWQVDIQSRKPMPLGWATHSQVQHARTGVVSRKTGYVNHIVPVAALRPMSAFKLYVAGLHTTVDLGDGQMADVQWEPSRLSARITTTDHMAIVYHGIRNKTSAWFTTDTADEQYPSPTSACDAVYARLRLS